MTSLPDDAGIVKHPNGIHILHRSMGKSPDAQALLRA
jgi:hypothetical protein